MGIHPSIFTLASLTIKLWNSIHYGVVSCNSFEQLIFKRAACVHFTWLLVCAINYLNGCLNLVLFT